MSKVDKFWKYFTWLAVIGALCVSMLGACVSIWAVGDSVPPPTSGTDTCESAWGNAYAWELVNSTYGNFLAMTAYLDCGPPQSYLQGVESAVPVSPLPAPNQGTLESVQFCAMMESTFNVNFDQCMVTEGF